MRLPVSRTVLSLGIVLFSAGALAETSNGPAADYPVTVGAPYRIGNTTFTPVDTLNYDAVGRALVGTEGGQTISGAHHTLPVPCYVEVTSLETGRTILVRLDRRGAMQASTLIELSPGAAAQLGVSDQSGTAVRVRRVNPPEVERAVLRAGGQAPARMDTPVGLVGALKRKLALQESVPSAPVSPVLQAIAAAGPGAMTTAVPLDKPKPEPELPRAKPQPASAGVGDYVVQVGVFARKPNADAAARKLDTAPQAIGKMWRVRLGPFASRASADAALAKVRAAGYSDARVQRAG